MKIVFHSFKNVAHIFVDKKPNMATFKRGRGGVVSMSLIGQCLIMKQCNDNIFTIPNWLSLLQNDLLYSTACSHVLRGTWSYIHCLWCRLMYSWAHVNINLFDCYLWQMICFTSLFVHMFAQRECEYIRVNWGASAKIGQIYDFRFFRFNLYTKFYLQASALFNTNIFTLWPTIHSILFRNACNR